MNNPFKLRQKQIEETLYKISSEERTILKTIAFSLHSHDEYAIKAIGLKYSIKNSVVATYIKKWKKENIFFDKSILLGFYSTDLILDYEITLYLIREIVNEGSIEVYSKKSLKCYGAQNEERTRNRDGQ